MDTTSSAPEADTGRGQEASSSRQGSGVDLTACTRGAWKGSDVKQAEIDWLYRSRRIPAEVACRIPGDELEPVPLEGETVVFVAHFERGFGLPASDFFRRFLDFFELQPHHLPGNAIFYLSCYVSFMEAYVGLSPTIEAFSRFFTLRINSVQGKNIPKPKPPARERFPRIAAEVRKPCRKNRLDTVDPDPYVPRNSKMGRTHTSRPGNFPIPCSAKDSSSDDEVTILKTVLGLQEQRREMNHIATGTAPSLDGELLSPHGSSSGDEDGGEDGSGVDGEAFRGHFPIPAACRNRDSCPPDLGFVMAAALEGFAYRGLFVSGF
ncbi:hypothetical protein QYE76_011293 [Lolium multiflorum]|uniref:Transposase (putative) gypsy type domain-containing protein n=1 Tax=Lolium multiflorum TaxID=4521 RepID=A0AAD8TV39_LOLMU|nr:hypothetical protein QYE76_011293 [Lolium multiflorum]